MIWNATKFMQLSCHLFWTKYYVYIYIYVSSYFKIQKWSEMQPTHTNFMSLVLKLYVYIYHDSLRYKNLLANATHSCKFHVIGSEITYICVCVHTLFLHAVVHVDESSSVFPLVHQEISSVFLICLIIL